MRIGEIEQAVAWVLRTTSFGLVPSTRGRLPSLTC
jgi:hypothetical protein